MMTLSDINLLLAAISVVLLVFSEATSIKSKTVQIRFNKNRLRKVIIISTMAFMVTLMFILFQTFLANQNSIR